MFALYIFILVGVIALIVYMVKNKIKIKIKTFFKRGFKVRKGIFGIYCYCGFQGNGKTYSCVEYVKDNQDAITLFSNVDITGIDYCKYNGFSGLLKLRDCIDYAKSRGNDYIIFEGKKYSLEPDKQIVFIYDEIFSELQRGSRINTDVLDFITQMRKRSFILLTTAQIWSDIPITWRRLTRYQIDCTMHHFLGLNYLKKVFHDAEVMRWDNDEQDFVAPIIQTTITHTRKYIADSYDTFQLIHNKDSKFIDITSNTDIKKLVEVPKVIETFGSETNNTLKAEGAGEFDKYFWSDLTKKDVEV